MNVFSEVGVRYDKVESLFKKIKYNRVFLAYSCKKFHGISTEGYANFGMLLILSVLPKISRHILNSIWLRDNLAFKEHWEQKYLQLVSKKKVKITPTNKASSSLGYLYKLHLRWRAQKWEKTHEKQAMQPR